MTGKEIIEAIIAHTKMKAPTLASFIGVSYQRIYDIQREKTFRLSPTVIAGITSTFPEFNKLWLATGEGPMLKSEKTESEPESPSEMTQCNEEMFWENKNGIKYFELRNGCYRMRVPLIYWNDWERFTAKQKENDFQISDNWDKIEFITPIVGQGRYFAFQVKGDSMDNNTKLSIGHGDFVLAREVDKSYWKVGLRYNQYLYWIIVLDSGILCKQIIDQDLETEEITLHSQSKSPEFSDFKINLNEIRGIYNVVQKMTAPTGYF